MAELLPEIRVVTDHGLNYMRASDDRALRFRPWLMDGFSFLYDFSMRSTVFPRQFGASIQRHEAILAEALADVRGERVLELAAGSGSSAHVLPADNHYTGIDISPGLLRQAARRFARAGFADPEYYVVSAEELPFAADAFDAALCILALNFFGDIGQVMREVERVLAPMGKLLCCVPVPERNRLGRTIRGTLYSAAEWQDICRAHGFHFEALARENGALFYFRATKQAHEDMHAAPRELPPTSAGDRSAETESR